MIDIDQAQNDVATRKFFCFKFLSSYSEIAKLAYGKTIENIH